MFQSFKKSTNITDNKALQNNQKKPSYIKFLKELEEKFPNYNFSELAFDECFIFIYKNIGTLKDTLIISATLRQIEPTIEDVKLVYLIDDQYINNLIDNKLPELRVLAYKRLEEIPSEQVAFFPNFHNNFEPLYKDLINRIEYLFEIKRNTKKILFEKKVNKYIPKLINNSSLLYLLNYLSIKDSLIIASSLDIIDLDEDTITEIYPHEDNYLEKVFDKTISMIKRELSERIKMLEAIEPETSYFDYNNLCNQYKDLNERIDDTLVYLNNKYKKR